MKPIAIGTMVVQWRCELLPWRGSPATGRVSWTEKEEQNLCYLAVKQCLFEAR